MRASFPKPLHGHEGAAPGRQLPGAGGRHQGHGSLPTARTRASIALLTPGPYNETYFEHAYLARYLGLTLVEGSDLTVRDQRLYLKTLSGLEPVDALIKRLDDEWLDPLELRSDSALGVPGLLQVMRAGNVLLANAPGSARWSPAPCWAFCPPSRRHLLGEELHLPALPTWWCGEARRPCCEVLPQLLRDQRDQAHLPKHSAWPTVMGQSLSKDAQGLDEWLGRMATAPARRLHRAVLPAAVANPHLDGRAT